MTARKRSDGPMRVWRPTPYSEADLAVLADAGRGLAGSLELSALLGRASSFIVPRLADWYVLTLREADGRLKAVTFEHSDPLRRVVLGRLVAGTEFEHPPLSAMARAGRGTHAWFPRLAESGSHGVCGWSDADFSRLSTGSVICAPLCFDSATTGALLLGRGAQDAYDATSVQVVGEIARRLGTAIANAKRFEAAQEQLRQMHDALAVAAHELRTPTAALSGYAQLYLRQYDHGGSLSPERVREVLFQFDSQAGRLAGMIDRLLDAASVDAGKLSVQPAVTDMRTLVSTVVGLARTVAPDRTITWRASRTVRADVDVDPLRIEQVISNLLDNALKFSPTEAPVEISLRTRRPNKVILAIRDHGVGVPPEQRARIFDRFAQVHRNRQPGGLGLGLYLSRHIIEQHGGRLTADYPQDGGAKFIVELPTLASIASPHAIDSQDSHGGRIHDTARAQSDWRTGGHARRSAGKLRAARVNRAAGVPGAVATSLSA